MGSIDPPNLLVEPPLHTCASPIGHIRCRAMETVIESVFLPCINAKLGCAKKVPFLNESTHKKDAVSLFAPALYKNAVTLAHTLISMNIMLFLLIRIAWEEGLNVALRFMS